MMNLCVRVMVLVLMVFVFIGGGGKVFGGRFGGGLCCCLGWLFGGFGGKLWLVSVFGFVGM